MPRRGLCRVGHREREREAGEHEQAHERLEADLPAGQVDERAAGYYQQVGQQGQRQQPQRRGLAEHEVAVAGGREPVGEAGRQREVQRADDRAPQVQRGGGGEAEQEREQGPQHGDLRGDGRRGASHVRWDRS